MAHDMDENDEIFLHITRGMPSEEVVERAKGLGWSDTDCEDLKAYISASKRASMGEFARAAEIYGQLLESPNFYVRYYSQIFCVGLSQAKDDTLTAQSESLLIDLARSIGESSTSHPFDAVAWIKLAARIDVMLFYARCTGIRWPRLLPVLQAVLSSIDRKPHELVKSSELHWVLYKCSSLEHKDIQSLTHSIAETCEIKLSDYPDLFP